MALLVTSPRSYGRLRLSVGCAVKLDCGNMFSGGFSNTVWWCAGTAPWQLQQRLPQPGRPAGKLGDAVPRKAHARVAAATPAAAAAAPAAAPAETRAGTLAAQSGAEVRSNATPQGSGAGGAVAGILVVVCLLAFGWWLLKTPSGQRSLQRLLHSGGATSTASSSTNGRGEIGNCARGGRDSRLSVLWSGCNRLPHGRRPVGGAASPVRGARVGVGVGQPTCTRCAVEPQTRDCVCTM